MSTTTCGSFNEEGFIKGLFRKGYTLNRCLGELLANMIDAAATNCVFIVSDSYIRIIDDGIGMDITNINNMFDMYRANHTADTSMGVSGLGAKPATAILSKCSEVIIYTHKKYKEYYKIIVPWDKIMEQNKYNGMIQIIEMTQEECDYFDKHRKQDNKTGTTIEFKYNEELHGAIECQFKSVDLKELPLDERWCCIFGKTDLNIWYTSTEIPLVKLNMYNYFSGSRMDYYKGVDIKFIKHYKDTHNTDRFIWENENGEYTEIAKAGRGFHKDISKLTALDQKQLENKWRLCGQYEIYVGMRKNKIIFDDDDVANTTTPFLNHTFVMCDYDTELIGISNGNKDVIRDSLCKVAVVRNNQVITRVCIDGFKPSSVRANAEAALQVFHLRCEIVYNTVSSQDNPMDICMGIQENKNQHSGELPLPLSRLIGELKFQKYTEIKKYFSEKIEAHMVEKRNDSHSDSDSDSDISTISQDDSLEYSTESVETVDEKLPEHVVAPTEETNNAISNGNKPDAVTNAITSNVASNINVVAFTKPSITGNQIITSMTMLLRKINNDVVYTDEYVDLFTLLEKLAK
jgi:hypothetical protein